MLGTKLSRIKSTCNCRNKEVFPLNWQCQTEETVSKGTFSSNQSNYKEKKCFGTTEESFKVSLYNHNLPFRNGFYKSDTELSKKLWPIKMKNYTSEITWRISGNTYHTIIT